MKPLTADNPDGRTLLALRAGPMTPAELADRVGSPSRWLIKVGYVEQDACYYRITEAGRAACPLRNPLAAPGTVRPAIYVPETDMSRNNCITRQQVLAAIVEAGAAGCSPKSLIERFECADQVIYNHVLSLDKQIPPVIFKPERGRIVTIQFNGMAPPRKVVETASSKEMHATRESIMAWLEKQPEGTGAVPAAIAQGIGCTEESTRAVLAGLFAGLKVDRQKVGNDLAYFIGQPKTETKEAEPVAACGEQTTESSPQAVLTSTDETQPEIVANTIPESHPRSEIVLPGGELALPGIGLGSEIAELLKQPMPIMPAVVEDVMLDDPEAVEFAIFSSGGLDIYCAETTVTLNKAVLGKLRSFLGLFQEGT